MTSPDDVVPEGESFSTPQEAAVDAANKGQVGREIIAEVEEHPERSRGQQRGC